MKYFSACVLMSYLILNTFQTSQLYAQQSRQNIKGVVVDKQSEFPLMGAEIVTQVQGQDYWAIADNNGNYLIENVPVGKISIKAFYNGFDTQTYTQVGLEVGKELVVNFSLFEKVATLDEVIIKSKLQRDNLVFVSASSYSFNIEQTNQYAGSLADVSRMAMNYAGVNSNDDSRNDIIVRGNNPSSLLWVMEGVNIPNPNHYSSSGSSGGPVNMLNSNTLKKSDFIAGAFPANFGNTASAVFDLQFREGNKDKYEFVGQLGFAGAELGAEGPFAKKSEASFLANYRYSTLAIFDKIGIDYGTGTATPVYQDATAVVNIPTKKIGTFKLWSIGGISAIKFNYEEEDSENLYFDGDASILKQDNKNLITGLNHKYFFNDKMSITSAVSYSKIDQAVDINTLNPITKDYHDFFHENLITNYSTVQTKIKKKYSAKNTIELGSSFTNYGIDFDIEASNNNSSAIKNNTGLSGTFVNWQHRFSDKLMMNSGLRYQYFTLNNQGAYEPRLGIKLKLNNNTNFNFSYGLHSNIQPLMSYFTEQEMQPDIFSYENTNVGFSKSHHFVVGIQTKIIKALNLKTEIYYQYLFDVPISHEDETYSIINTGYNDPGGAQIYYDALFNEGEGKNYGIDVSLERSLKKGFYLLLTGSLYDSKYLAKDNQWRNTAWNGKFMGSLLTGKELRINAKNALRLDLNINYAGGRRYTPIDLIQSTIVGEAVYENDKAFTEQLQDYFRTDVKLSYKMNGKKITQEWQLDLRNAFNTQNIFSQRYNATSNSIENTYQTGLLPVFQYKILF